jgi:hypothetical protein
MRFHWEHLAAGAAAIVVLMLTWFAGPIFHVVGSNALVLRGGILLLGVISIIGLLLWARSARPSLPAAEPGSIVQMSASSGASGASQDVDILVREAAGKVFPSYFCSENLARARRVRWTRAAWMPSSWLVRYIRKAASFQRE